MNKRARAVSYFLSIAAIAMIFFGVEHFIEKFFFHDYDLVDIISAAVAAVSFSECRRFFDHATDRIFFRGPRDAKAEFFTNISHELQTPLAILRGNVELFQRRGISEPERATAERVIMTTLNGMSLLIGSALDGAKMKCPVASLCIVDIDAGLLLREAWEDCLLLAEDKGIQFSVDVDVGAALPIRGDRGRLKEVLLNLISNALKYTARSGEVALRADRAGSIVRIVVEDSGCGIAPEALPHVFERFYRIRSSISPPGVAGIADETPSNGIGLNICREIVEAHKGMITAESDPGKGSRFIISLPLSVLSPSASPEPGAREPSSASAIINS